MFFAAIEVEEIIDHLHADKATLGACSLVCKAWLRPCRYHLFGELNLPKLTSRVETLLKLLEDDNYIVPFVRHVSCYGFLACDTAPFFDLLDVLNNSAPVFKSLSFRYYNLIFAHLECYFPLDRLTQLNIMECTLESWDNLMDLISALPCVEELIVGTVRASSRLDLKPPANRNAILLPKLCSLELYVGMVGIILPLLAPAPRLRKAKFRIYDVAELSTIRNFLGDITPHLEIFSLSHGVRSYEKDIGQCLQNIDFGALKGLYAFDFDMYTHATLSDIPAALERITSPMINRIKFSFVCEPELEEGVWKGIPTILAGPQFQQLRKLEFDLDTWISGTEETEMWIRAELYELKSRGITVQFHLSPSGLWW